MAVSRFSRSSAQEGFPKSQNVWDQKTTTPALDALGSVTFATTTASVLFSSIPQTYTNLEVRIFAIGVTNGDMLIQLNGSNMQKSHFLFANPGTAAGATTVYTGYLNYATNLSDTYPYISLVSVLDYKNTNKLKTVKGWFGINKNATTGSEINLTSHYYNSTSPVTSLTITATGGGFGAGTQISLYGVK
jgi:hypothetical protein